MTAERLENIGLQTPEQPIARLGLWLSEQGIGQEEVAESQKAVAAYHRLLSPILPERQLGLVVDKSLGYFDVHLIDVRDDSGTIFTAQELDEQYKIYELLDRRVDLPKTPELLRVDFQRFARRPTISADIPTAQILQEYCDVINEKFTKSIEGNMLPEWYLNYSTSAFMGMLSPILRPHELPRRPVKTAA